MKGEQLDERIMKNLGKKLGRATEKTLADPKNKIWHRGRGPGSVHPFHRGVHHNPVGGPSGNIDWARVPETVDDTRRLARAAEYIIRDYGPGGIARRYGQNEFFGYPVYIA